MVSGDFTSLLYNIHPPVNVFINKLENIFGNKIEQSFFYLPYDLKDGFFFSAWRYPEKYLDETFCAGISSLAEAKKDVLQKSQEKLKRDIISGRWNELYGNILNNTEYDCGYLFLKTIKSSSSVAIKIDCIKEGYKIKK